MHEALDLCLACKGCRHECPVQVDMATYKAEFMAHYYQHHRRPRQAWTLGMIHEWSRLAGRMPKLVNALTAMPGAAGLARMADRHNQTAGICRVFRPSRLPAAISRVAHEATARRSCFGPIRSITSCTPRDSTAAARVLENAWLRSAAARAAGLLWPPPV